jgi:uncharacterized phage protein (TIGR02218 family)
MGFSLFEIGKAGRPVCLYEFVWGATTYRYTSADRIVEWGVDEFDVPLQWHPKAISDSGFTQGQDQQDFTVTLPRNLPIVDLFRSTPPSTPILLTCRRFHKDDVDEEAVVYWVGTVGNIRGKTDIESEVLGLPISRTLRRTGLRCSWRTGCIHALYGPGCNVDKELFKAVTTITALTGTTVDVASFGTFAGAQYAGGYLEWEASAEGTLDRRPIESYNGGMTLGLLTTTDRLIVGQAVTIYIGCDLTPTMCDGTFGNLANHGGFEFMPKKSPFDGDQVF